MSAALQVFCNSCLLFGLQSAPRSYSICVGELHRVMREIGGELSTYLLDDKLGTAPTLAQACFRCLAGVKLFAAAGKLSRVSAFI